MRIHLYTVSFNERAMLDFFFRHYRPWVARFVVFDDNSTDGTAERLRAMPDVDLRRRPYSNPDSLVLSGKTLRDHCWKESRGHADWVVIVDIDEHLHHPHLEDYLQTCKRDGVTLIPALGYEMLTDAFPAPDEHLSQTRTIGAPSPTMSKLRVFDPDAIEEVDFFVGGHAANPRGRLVYPERDELLLLHYKHLGLDYALERNSSLEGGRRKLDRQNHWGHQYTWMHNDYVAARAAIAAGAVDIGSESYVPSRDHTEGRWWRGTPANGSEAWFGVRPLPQTE